VLSEAEDAHTAQARDSARKLLLDARSEVEAAVEELKRAADTGADLDEAIHRARSRVEHAADRNRPGQEGSARRTPRAPAGLGPGDRVRLRATGAKGRVTEVRSGRAVVEAGAIKLEVALGDLERVEGGGEPANEPARSGSWTGPDRGSARVEVDLRGLRVHELEVALSRALDEAILEDLPELRIIHGKGTGALRQRVGEMLETDGRVRSVRMGGPTEGGAGVTVAGFKEPS
jgi:DNA mismatch repair protein MutS2